VVYEKNSPLGIVYQIPVLGGSPQRVAQDVDTPITFSPDGKRFAWVRNFPQSGETSLFVANSDGTNEQKIVSRQRPVRFTAGAGIGPSWSPENDVVAVTAAGPEEGVDKHSVVLVDLNSRTEKDATPHRWSFLQQVAWTSHNAGLVVAAQEQQGGSTQLWYVEHPGGEVSRITNDLNNYNGVSISADGSTLATVQSQNSSTVWVAPNARAEAAIKLTSGTNEGGNGLAFMPDGRIIYTVFGGGKSDMFMVNPDGTNQRQLTANAGLNALPYASPDGRYIVFVSTRTGSPHIWRMNSDGSNLKQLTNGIAEVSPIVTPDNQWIVYQSADNLGLWKISIDGGSPVQVIDKLASQHAISPDGKLLACRYREQDLSPFVLAVIDFASGKLVKTIDIPPPTNNSLDWSSDGRSVLFTDTRGGVSNIWSQAIEGGAPRQATNFKSELIFAFDLSSDGKQMALSRGTVSNNVVLIREGN
jgi:TolB protein